MTPRDAWRIKAGMACFALAGPLSVIGLYMRGPIIDQRFAPDAWAAGSATDSFALSWVFLLPNLIMQILGWIALWGAMRQSRFEGLAFWGMVLSIVGNGLFLPHTGVIAFVTPSLAELYLEGRTELVDVANQGLFGPLSLPFLIGSAFGLLAGAICHGLLVWREPSLPSWAALPYVLHALFLTFVAPHAYALEYTGGVLLLVSSAAIALAVWRTIGRSSVGAAPRAKVVS